MAALASLGQALRTVRLLIIFLGFAAALLFLCSAMMAHKAALLDRDGITLTATVTDIEQVRLRGYAYAEVTVQFTPPGLVRAHATVARTSPSFGRGLQIGGQIPVRVLPEAWDYLAVEPGRLARISRNVALGGLVCTGLGLFSILATARNLRRAGRLARHGVATTGWVMWLDPARSDALQQALHWRYMAPDGQMRRVKTMVYVGSGIAVLPRGGAFAARYDPADLRNAAPDALVGDFSD